MSRSTLHTPFAQQHTRSSSSSSSSSGRVSPFQQAATAASLEPHDLENGWLSNQQGSEIRQRLRERFVEAFEAMDSPAHGSSTIHNFGRSRDQDQQHMEQPGAATQAHLRIVVAEDVLNSSSTRPHIIRAHAILTTSSSSREHLPSTHPVDLSHLHATNSLDSDTALSPSSSRRHSGGSSSSSSSSMSLRRLQRRSSSLLAATSATASNLWASFSDRSRALLCRNSPVSDSGARGNSMDGRTGMGRSSSGGGGRRSSTGSEPGGRISIESVPLGPGVDPVAIFGSPVAGGLVRAPRLSHRLLLRSTAIRRSAGARSPAVLIDVDATDSYDDLLALDQFNVKRAVKGSVLKGLPSRTPNAADAQQQRQCHICFESWLPSDEKHVDDVVAAAGRAQGASAAAAAPMGCETDQQGCCQCCGLQQQQYIPQLPPLLNGQRQRVLDRMQLVCWDGPIGPEGVIIPAPAAAQLMHYDVMHDGATPPGYHASSSNSPRHRSSRSGGGPVVQGWTGLTADGAAPHAGHRQLLRQVGPSRVDAAATGSPLASQRGAAVLAATHTHSSSSSSRSSTIRPGCSCRRLEGPAAERLKPAGVQIQQLPCGHEFCSGCIQPWLKEHTSCPVCRWTFPDCDTRLINK